MKSNRMPLLRLCRVFYRLFFNLNLSVSRIEHKMFPNGYFLIYSIIELLNSFCPNATWLTRLGMYTFVFPNTKLMINKIKQFSLTPSSTKIWLLSIRCPLLEIYVIFLVMSNRRSFVIKNITTSAIYPLVLSTDLTMCHKCLKKYELYD